MLEEATLTVPRTETRRTETVFPFVAGIFLIAALFLAGALGRAHQKLLWHDEIIAVVIAGLPLQNIWTALGDGVDLNPPGFHVLLRASHAVFGEGLIRSRLPSAVSVLFAAFCVGVFVRRRLGGMAGLMAALVFLCTPAYLYAYEARPYGSVLACAGAACVCWQAATIRTPRAGWLAGLFASLAGALTFHYYTVLLFAPIVVAEIVRLGTRRRADWPMWITVTLSTMPLLAWRPLIMTAREFSAAYSAGPRLPFVMPSVQIVIDSYESTISELAVPTLVTLILGGSVVTLKPRQWNRPLERLGKWIRLASDGRDPGATSLPAHEWTLAAVLVLLPVVAFLLAFGWTGALVPRYYLAWTIGLSILVPLSIARMVSCWRDVVLILACVLFVWYGTRQAASARLLAEDGPDIRSAYPLLVRDSMKEPIPIVIGHSHVYLMALEYLPPEVQSRLFTLTPPDGVSPRSDAAIRVFRGLRKWKPVRLEHFDRFVANYRRFFVYGPSSSRVLKWLEERDALLVLRGIDEDAQPFSTSRPGANMLYEATLPLLTPVADSRSDR